MAEPLHNTCKCNLRGLYQLDEEEGRSELQLFLSAVKFIVHVATDKIV